MKRISKSFPLLLCIFLFLNSCSSKLIYPNRLNIDNATKIQEYDFTGFNHKYFLEEIKNLNKKIQNTTYTAEKYDELLNQLSPLIKKYKLFKALEFNSTDFTFAIQPHSKMIFKFNTYCLNSGNASPSQNEQFVLKKDPPDIPLYKDIAIYTNSKEKLNSLIKQLLLWNLKNNVKFENLPLNQQTFLLKMDPMSYLKINNLIKSEIKSYLTKFVKSNIPFYDQAENNIKLIKGTAYTYQDYSNNIERLVSKLKLVPTENPIKANGYDIYTLTQSSSYSTTVIIFINITELKQFINCFSFLDPLRTDVQPLGFDIPEIYEEHEKYKNEIDKEFENTLTIILIKINNDGLGKAKTIKDNPTKILDLIKADKAQKIAIERTKQEFGYNGENDESDAFMHAFWNAIMVRDLGESFAEEVSTNHEIFSSLKEKNMDLHNNKVGREIGKKLKEAGITDNDSYAKEILANKDKLFVLYPKSR